MSLSANDEKETRRKKNTEEDEEIMIAFEHSCSHRASHMLTDLNKDTNLPNLHTVQVKHSVFSLSCLDGHSAKCR